MLKNILLISILACVVGVGDQRLSPPSRSVAVADLEGVDWVPGWERGVLLSVDFDTSTISVYDQAGQLQVRRTLSLADAASVHILDVSAAPGGGLAASASVQSRAGAWASFIYWLDSRGQIVRTVRTSPGAANLICFADDGTLWAVMWVHGADFREAPHYDVLRHYDTDGRMIGSTLPRERVSGKPLLHALSGDMTASADRIGIYAREVDKYIEVSNAGDIIGQWTLPGAAPGAPVGARLQIDNVVLTSSNEVFAGIENITRDGHATGGIYHLNKTTSAFEAVNTDSLSEGSGGFVQLYGAAGNELVVRAGRSRPYLWASPQSE